MQTKVGAKTLTLDSKTNHVLLITADFGPPSAPAAGAPPPGHARRGPMLPGTFSVLVAGK